MFTSATIKLTAWYLAVLMAISLTFSIVIYQINYHEIDTRLQKFQESVVEIAPGVFLQGEPSDDLNVPRAAQTAAAARQLIWSLFWVNVVVLFAGGLASYLFARRTLEPIERAHEAQSRFTSDASHELRTPLAAMKTELEVTLRDPKIDEDEARELLESNLEEVNNLIALSEMLLALSRLENPEQLKKEKVDLVPVLEQKMKHYHRLEKRFDVTMKKKALAEVNSEAISEVMGILIDNAIKYSPENSKITIRLYGKRNTIGFEIHNIGTPIPEKHIHHIFDRFYRVDSSRTNGKKSGYGLGLSIAKKIVDLHRGHIEVTSGEEGTTFTVLIPAR